MKTQLTIPAEVAQAVARLLAVCEQVAVAKRDLDRVTRKQVTTRRRGPRAEAAGCAEGTPRE
jgi:hypothetical protein